jgi:hypothetical protein
MKETYPIVERMTTEKLDSDKNTKTGLREGITLCWISKQKSCDHLHSVFDIFWLVCDFRQFEHSVHSLC